jgi:hypothetical protein
LLERHDLGGLDHGSSLQLPAVFAQIDPFGDQPPVLRVQLAGALERDVLDRPDTDPPFLAGDRVAARPRL